MDSLSKKIQNLGIHDFRNAGRFMQNMIVQYEPYQIDIRRATNTDAWGPTTKHLQKVIRNKYSVPLYLMTEYVLKRIVDHLAKRPKNLYEKARKEYVNYGSEWRIILKCLIVIEYLLLNVSEPEELNQVKSCLENHKQIFNSNILNYKIEFCNDGKMEVHERGIQKKCEVIINLVDDPEFLREERSKNKKNMMKIQRSGSESYQGSISSSASSSSAANYEYNANAMDSIEFDLEEHTSSSPSVEPQQRNRRLSNIEEQRKQRREILRERIKQTEHQRKLSQNSNHDSDDLFKNDTNKMDKSQVQANENVPDLIDMDFDTTPSTTPAATTTTATTTTTTTAAATQEDDADEFGDFQSDANPTNKLTTTSSNTDAFADLFANSKSLI
ncbi:hypothetical protein Kpol_344p8 [Vanderwaltozyma polyspora DSM 70294]|uniref:ENTH domain-containing protein n=1 Tax=Vanderwaltozyma polyspora (strain ATCC 22028 / DSM 70294 / BCRC 21397 / CBS 2163 / NBRC 10782 / NRRL Y-8283 / UCD 57-17) TaxID=436907 RepID=A7TSS4_VANPO|nr:uncharacterized protein Kpol_344p8 [Vanderwaltozyma polyspora DSM 70294]EDO14688.1 hypothetical protein Kpol_344p8 [Vanderwaltozyma polyspora DSM 70294]